MQWDLNTGDMVQVRDLDGREGRQLSYRMRRWRRDSSCSMPCCAALPSTLRPCLPSTLVLLALILHSIPSSHHSSV